MSAAGMDEPLAVREAPVSYLVELETQRVRPGYKQTEVGGDTGGLGNARAPDALFVQEWSQQG